MNEDRAVLEEVRIQGLGVIDDATLQLSPGLTVLTGETGAGKTMVVQGLALLFGGRSDAGRVRPEAGRAVVEGRLVVPEEHPAAVRALDAGAELDEGALLLSRSVSADGRSRAHLGGRSVPVGVLAEVGGEVLVVHGQNDQQRFLEGARQREALDRYAGPELLAQRDRFAGDWARLRDLRATIAQLASEAQERDREAELLRLGLAEIEQVAPASGEDRALAEQVGRLAHADGLRAAAEAAREALTGDEHGVGTDALGLVVAARRALEQAAGHDPALDALADRAREAAVLVGDLAQELASYAASVDADPARLAALQDRQAALTALVRRHAAADVDAVLAWAAGAGLRLLEVDGTEDRVAALRQEEGELASSLAQLAAALTSAREAASARLSAEVTAQLRALAMPDAVVRAVVAQRDGEALQVGERRLAAGPHGTDDVELLLAPHPGAPSQPLGKGASGGELSRVMLAVQAVLAEAQPVPVMVFDEVDAGVGGAAAVEVGRCLARLAGSHQVLVVTHLPQVAAFADRHLHVVKATGSDAVTRGGVRELDGEDRVAELSRMLAGLDSATARAHAVELLDEARALRTG